MTPARPARPLVDEDLAGDPATGPFVIELVAQVDDRQPRGYLDTQGDLVPLARARTFTSALEAASVAGETAADGDGLLAAFVRPRSS